MPVHGGDSGHEWPGQMSPFISHLGPPCASYAQVQFISSILGLLWPVLSSAVYKEVLVQAKQPLEDACKMTGGLVTSLAITELDLGTIPPRLDSFKTMHSESDELIIEVG